MAPRTSAFGGLLATVALGLATFPTLLHAALHEVDQVYYGAWVDPDLPYRDSPVAYNTRLGLNASVFHIAQQMPIPKYNYVTGAGGPAPEYLIENTATDAAVFLTVYPVSVTNLTIDDYTALANQVLGYQVDKKRKVFVRWGPEMQGDWNPYGRQPTAYVAAWKAMYQVVKSIAPDTALVWAPNLGNGYPYGTFTPSAADLALLDTSHDGTVDAADDPYAPYYPGDQYVDWIGLSVYYKQNGHDINTAQAAGFCSDIFTGQDTTSGTHAAANWYQVYCAGKPDKACMIAESGAAYHPNSATNTATQLQIQQAWWTDCITNPTLFTTYPRIKLTMHFEYEKLEFDTAAGDLRDYRLTNDTTMLAAYQKDLATVHDQYVWAAYQPLTSPTQSTGPGASAPVSATGTGAIVPTLVLQTLRNPQVTGPPSLFGVVISGAVRVGAPMAIALAGSVGLGAWLVAKRSVAL